jgi:hypothetical protein
VGSRVLCSVIPHPAATVITIVVILTSITIVVVVVVVVLFTAPSDIYMVIKGTIGFRGVPKCIVLVVI